VATAQTERTARAQIEARAAEALAQTRGGEAAASLCAWRATLLDPSRKDAPGRLRALREAHHLAPGESVPDEKLGAIDAGLRDHPDNAALLLQRARWMKERGDVAGEAAALWRAVRAKHDAASLERLRTLLCGAANAAVPELPRAVRDLIGSRSAVAKGAAAASATAERTSTGAIRAGVPTRHAQAPVLRGNTDAVAITRGGGDDLESTSWAVRGVIVSVLLLALAGIFWMVSGLARSAHAAADAPAPPGAQVEVIERILHLARSALDAGDPSAAQQYASEVLEKEDLSIETGREALWIRSLARRSLGMGALAKQDLLQMKGMGGADDPRAPAIDAALAAIDSGQDSQPQESMR
jgi:hypothetical protein